MFGQEFFIVLMLISLLAILMTGFPVAFTLSGVALFFGIIGSFCNIFDMAFIQALPNRIYGIMTNECIILYFYLPKYIYTWIFISHININIRCFYK